MTNPDRPADAGPADRLADGTAGERGRPGHGLLDGRAAAPAQASPALGPAGDAAAMSVAGFAAQLRELRERADGRLTAALPSSPTIRTPRCPKPPQAVPCHRWRSRRRSCAHAAPTWRIGRPAGAR